MAEDPVSRFKVPLADLERSAHVPPEEQVEEVDTPPNEGPPQLPKYVRDALEAARLGG